jgi:hypothetical protein
MIAKSERRCSDMDLIDRKALLIQIEISPQNTFIRNTPLAMDLRKLYSNGIKLAPTVEAIPKGAYEQVKWERDMAVQQLNDYGVQLGEKADCAKVVRCNDCNHYSRGVCWNENITSNCDCDLEKEPNGYCDWGERRGD